MEVIIITKCFLCGHLALIILFHLHKTSIWNIYSKTKKTRYHEFKHKTYVLLLA